MPFFNSTYQQTELFIETIDKLQGFLDQYAVMAPIKIVGDYNVQLPQGHKLKNNWYKLPGFNRHSIIMHDFLISNNMIVTDFMFQQSVKYTYFCHKSNIHTWIDHVASSDYDLKHISRCHIMPQMPCNVTDHLPVICVIKVYISPTKAPTCDSSYVGYRPPVYIKWDSPGVKEKYLDYLESKLHDLLLFDGTGNIDSHVEKLNAAMRDAAQCAGCVPRRVFKPKPYWCPELSQLRDRKRFWWTLWVANDRPRHGAVYECHKSIKKLFRKMCRKKYKTCLTMNFMVLMNVSELETWIHFGTKSKENGKIIKRIHLLMPKLSLILIGLLWAATTLR